MVEEDRRIEINGKTIAIGEVEEHRHLHMRRHSAAWSVILLGFLVRRPNLEGCAKKRGLIAKKIARHACENGGLAKNKKKKEETL